MSPLVTSSIDGEFPKRRKWNSYFDDISYVILKSIKKYNDPGFVHWISMHMLAYLLYNQASI